MTASVDFKALIDTVQTTERKGASVWEQMAKLSVKHPEYGKFKTEGATVVKEVFDEQENELVQDLEDAYQTEIQSYQDNSPELNNAHEEYLKKREHVIVTFKNSTYRSNKSVIKQAIDWNIDLLKPNGNNEDVHGKTHIEQRLKGLKQAESKTPESIVNASKKKVYEIRDALTLIQTQGQGQDPQHIRAVSELAVEIRAIDKKLGDMIKVMRGNSQCTPTSSSSESS